MTEHAGLLDLCHRIGNSDIDLALSAEGNVSVRGDDEFMTIKATGCSLATMTASDLVDVRRSTLMALLDSDPSDDDVHAAYLEAKRDSADKKASVEAILHAVLYELTDAQVIAHTHPIAVNAIGCSRNPEILVQGALFPDAIVMMGRRQLLVPYVDPGVPLARAVRDAVTGFIGEEDSSPRVIYLANHGLFVLTGTEVEAWELTRMVVKNAQVLLGTMAAGGPNFLSPANVDRIDKRPDEIYRRQLLRHENGDSDD